jgi:hypothetical protein
MFFLWQLFLILLMPRSAEKLKQELNQAMLFVFDDTLNNIIFWRNMLYINLLVFFGAMFIFHSFLLVFLSILVMMASLYTLSDLGSIIYFHAFQD